jgi:8-oxo-dGTP diphosphatase
LIRRELPTVRVVAALIGDGGDPPRFLVQRRLPGVARALQWEFPGGKVENSEAEADALTRECREELEVELRVGGRLWSGVHRYEDLVVELVLYEARIIRGSPRPLKASELRYLTPSEMKPLPFCQADVPLLEALESGLAGAG